MPNATYKDAQGLTKYVEAVNGGDANAGSEANPFKLTRYSKLEPGTNLIGKVEIFSAAPAVVASTIASGQTASVWINLANIAKVTGVLSTGITGAFMELEIRYNAGAAVPVKNEIGQVVTIPANAAIPARDIQDILGGFRAANTEFRFVSQSTQVAAGSSITIFVGG